MEHLENKQEKIDYLKEQVNSYLLKDVLAFEGIKKREKIVELLKILAFRIGSEISLEQCKYSEKRINLLKSKPTLF